MNKQQSKESLKDKVKGMFGLGTTRPTSKQCDITPPEFIITSDIIKVSRNRAASIHVSHSCYLTLFLHHKCLFFSSQELRPDCGLNSRVRTINHVCGLAKTKKFEEVS